MRHCRLTLLFIFVFWPLFAAAQEIPHPRDWVNDFAGVISADYRQKITAIIQELEEKAYAEIAVITVNSIAPYDEKEYAHLVFEKWRPGKEGRDNGVLVLLAIKERRWRIETGYGIEGVLPDGRCGEIGREFMVPYFKDGRYGEGLYQGLRAIADILSGNTQARPPPSTPSDNFEPLSFLIIFIVVILIELVVVFSRYRHKRRSYYSGTGYDAAAGSSESSSWGGGGFSGGSFGGFGGGSSGGGGAGGGF